MTKKIPVHASRSPDSIRNVLTPEALGLIDAVGRTGSMAAAARELGVVPSALTYRIRVVEGALDVLLFDRSSRQAKITEAGKELLREGNRLLGELDAIANRVRRVATGWEPQLTLAVDSVISRTTIMELCEAFFALNPPTRLKLREEALSGTLQALTSGQADLAIGVPMEPSSADGVHSQVLGEISFVYVVAPHHPLAGIQEPITDAMMLQHRAVAVADSIQRGGGMTVGLLGGQDVFTVNGMLAKLDAQLRGLGAGFLPEYMARPYIDAGRLVHKKVLRPARVVRSTYAWRTAGDAKPGRALQWWLGQLGNATTRRALLERAQSL
ncbi:MAG: LysR family transcriptional regulator [Comamonadaceae bacterium]|nr:MAG: LysR family transcriptional regulator [Comamonadaceae bacterium]